MIHCIVSNFPEQSNNIESIAAGWGVGEQDYSKAINVLIGLIADKTYPGSAPHRSHLLGIGAWAAFTEVGAGYDFNPAADYRNYWAIHTGQQNTVKTFVTGVVYSDANRNHCYDINEGVGGVTVSAGGRDTTSNSRGGWALEAGDGVVRVSCSGPGFTDIASILLEIMGRSREIDCISGNSSAVVDFDLIPPDDVTLADAILALRAITSNPVDFTAYHAGDINGDAHVGLAEALYVMQLLVKTGN